MEHTYWYAFFTAQGYEKRAHAADCSQPNVQQVDTSANVHVAASTAMMLQALL